MSSCQYIFIKWKFLTERTNLKRYISNIMLPYSQANEKQRSSRCFIYLPLLRWWWRWWWWWWREDDLDSSRLGGFLSQSSTVCCAILRSLIPHSSNHSAPAMLTLVARWFGSYSSIDNRTCRMRGEGKFLSDTMLSMLFSISVSISIGLSDISLSG